MELPDEPGSEALASEAAGTLQDVVAERAVGLQVQLLAHRYPEGGVPLGDAIVGDVDPRVVERLDPDVDVEGVVGPPSPEGVPEVDEGEMRDEARRIEVAVPLVLGVVLEPEAVPDRRPGGP